MNFTRHKNLFIVFLIPAVIAIGLSSIFKKPLLSVETDRMLQVVMVVVSLSAFWFYKRYKTNLLSLRTVPSVEERFNRYSSVCRVFWLQLMLIVLMNAAALYLTANNAYLVVAVIILIFMIIFLPARIGAQLLLQIPKDHAVLK